MTAEARSQIQSYMDAHPRGKDGQVVYDVRQDFGADPAELRKAFDFYFEAFPGVKIQVRKPRRRPAERAGYAPAR